MLNDYASFVLSKAAPARQITKEEFDLLHAGLGLATEVLELTQSRTRENTHEEIQDLLWYTTFTGTQLGIKFDQLITSKRFELNTNEIPIESLQKAVEHLVSLIKKHVIYNKPRRDELIDAWSVVYLTLLKYIDACGYSLELAMHENRMKLDTRYAEGFTSEESEARKDKQ